MTSEPGKTRNDLAGHVVSAPPAAPRRRRLIGAAGGGVGVLLAVQAKTALGQTMCISMSGQMSGNTSPHSNHEVPCASGFSPGFWRQPQHFDQWSQAGAVPPTFNATVSECVSGMGKLSAEVIQTPGTLVGDVFSGMLVSPTLGFWEVIAFSDIYDSLPRHLICAWLNAGAVSGYPITRQQVQDIWSQLSTTGSYCPTSVTCTDGGLDAVQIQQMIEATYGDSTLYASTMCTVDDSSTASGGNGDGGGNGNGGANGNGGGKGGGKKG